jgi:hypothetical protein
MARLRATVAEALGWRRAKDHTAPVRSVSPAVGA